MSETENTQTAVENETNQDGIKTAKPKAKKKWILYLKVFSVFILFMLLSFGIAIFYVLNRLSNDSNFEKLINRKASEATNMDVNFEKIKISFPSLELTNIHIATDSAEMKLDSYIASVKLRPDFLAAISGNVVIDYLGISSSTTMLQMKAIKSTDEAKKVEDSNSNFDLNSISFPFRSLDIKDIVFNYIDDGIKTDYNLRLNRASLSHSLISSALPYEVDAEWIGKVALNANGDLYWPSKVTSNAIVKILDFGEIKKYVPEEYKSYLDGVTGSNVRASLDYNISNNSLSVKDYKVEIEPLANIVGNADVPSMAPLKLQAKANVSSLNIADIWPLVKDFIPEEYGVSLKNGSVEAGVEVGLDGDKPVAIKAEAKPQKIELVTKYTADPVVIKKGSVIYDGNKVSVNDFEAGLGNTNIKLQSLNVGINDLSINGIFGGSIDFESLLKNLQPYVSAGMNNLIVAGKILLEGNIKGSLSEVSSLKVNGNITSDVINLTEKTTKAKGLVENLNVRLSEVGAECGTISIEGIRVSATGANLNIKGYVKNQKDIGFDCAANGNVNVGEFSKLASSLFSLPVKEGQYKGNLDLDLTLKGSVKEPKPSGKIIAKNICADVSQYGVLIENFNGTVLADTDKLILNDIKAKALGGELDFNGAIKDFKNMKVEAVANVKGTDLALVRKMIGAFVPDMEPGLDFGGKANLNASLNGPTSLPKVNGSAQLIDAKFAHPAVLRPIEKINGRIDFNNEGLTSKKLTAYWGKSKVDASGSLKDWAKFNTNFKFDVAPLDVTDAAGFFLEGTGYNVLGTGIGSGTVTGPVEVIKVDCYAKVDVGTVTAVITEGGDSMYFPYQKLQARAVYNNNILNISSASLKLFDGDIQAKAKVYLASDPIRFDVDANINQLQTQEFLRANADKKYEKTLVGGLNGTASLKGDVTGLNSINGKASLAMPKGSYDSPDVIKKIADKLKQPQLASGTIENVSGDYTISNGRISSNNTMGKTKDSTVTYRGSVGLDTTLDGNLDFVLGPKTCDSGYLKELKGNSETLNLTAKVKGSLTSPNVDLPLEDILKKSAKNEIEKVLEKNNFLKSDKVKQEAGKAAEKISEGVSKLGKGLKKLFK